jgi:hypothetical protein
VVSIAGQARYFRTNIDCGAVGVGAAGEMAKVSQVFQPSGRLCAANSPKAKETASHGAARHAHRLPLY